MKTYILSIYRRETNSGRVAGIIEDPVGLTREFFSSSQQLCERLGLSTSCCEGAMLCDLSIPVRLQGQGLPVAAEGVLEQAACAFVRVRVGADPPTGERLVVHLDADRSDLRLEGTVSRVTRTRRKGFWLVDLRCEPRARLVPRRPKAR